MTVRPEVREVFERPDYDVVIIGGGINGLATFRDLAMQGVRVLLVERNDFASGASAASSHMIHGGIRYLENGEFRLVRESVRERNGLLRIAPHHVVPLATTIPIQGVLSGILAAPLRFLTHKQRTPKARGAVLIKIGLTIYDLFSRDGGSVPRHRFRGRRASRRELPELAPDFRFTATYYDASLRDPERLALDVALDGEAAGDATALNYVEAVGGDQNGVMVRDVLTGTEQTITARVIVNASGPWTDLTARALGQPSTLMGGTKGSHIVLDNPELLAATGGREIFFEHQDGRIVLVYPLKGRVLVGTTDLDADPGEPAVCTEEEVDYFFELVAQVFPDVTVDRSQIVYRFSGIRPLPRHDDMVPGFVSRDYRVVDTQGPGAPMLNLVGGKWTTFRALGEQLTDRVLALLQSERRVSTEDLPIGGGRGYPLPDAKDAWIRSELGGVSRERGRVLLERYGTKARDVVNFLALAHDEPILGDRLSSREVAYFVEQEKATRLNDVLLRRTDVTYTGDLTDDVFEHTLGAFADAAGWDAARIEEERSRSLAELRVAHGVAPRAVAERAGQRRRASR
ncbi:glycerol-3-phosphate dehydrogenase/oxidase [Microbacterium sp. CJ77]|uniref:glycerol-3-phosphate dehydrogenase/oxidase n=1 Tax=Microbacterium sp. CJ77 TaxID=2079201 RepID=UPI000CD8AD9D|nr:glycerol-3-phosphate dehydrogenase/oxidase [Microbacterium sp. CJ77]